MGRRVDEEGGGGGVDLERANKKGYMYMYIFGIGLGGKSKGGIDQQASRLFFTLMPSLRLSALCPPQ